MPDYQFHAQWELLSWMVPAVRTASWITDILLFFWSCWTNLDCCAFSAAEEEKKNEDEIEREMLADGERETRGGAEMTARAGE